MDDKKISVALNTIPGLRAVTYHRALERFGSPSGVLDGAGKGLLTSLPGVGPALERAVRALNAPEAWEREARRAEDFGVSILTLYDGMYPSSLREIPDPPPVLYVRGAFDDGDGDAVAVVGSRAATEAGRLTAERISRDLASAGVTVVSGLARGIDSCAHRGALDGGGRTIAVLGSALDRIYPPENRELAGRVAAAGALVTEFPFGTGPEKWHFPLRNRVVSGLSLGVVIVEAARRSGALITGALALDQGREVFAVPGSVSSPLSEGPHALIRDGARLVTGAAEVLEEFPHLRGRLAEPRDRGSASLTAPEKEVLAGLGTEPLSVDELIRRSPVPSSRVLSLLTALEVKGLVKQLAGRRYVRP